jgi:hypothetical protein
VKTDAFGADSDRSHTWSKNSTFSRGQLDSTAAKCLARRYGDSNLNQRPFGELQFAKQTVRSRIRYPLRHAPGETPFSTYLVFIINLPRRIATAIILHRSINRASTRDHCLLVSEASKGFVRVCVAFRLGLQRRDKERRSIKSVTLAFDSLRGITPPNRPALPGSTRPRSMIESPASRCVLPPSIYRRISLGTAVKGTAPVEVPVAVHSNA